MRPRLPFVAAAALAVVPIVCVAGTGAAGPSVPDLLAQGDRVAQADEQFPESLQRAVSLYREAGALDPQNPLPYLRMARAYLALGDGTKDDPSPWYERGKLVAERALALKEDSADAHFFLAANWGRAIEHVPFWKVPPTVVSDLENHLSRALALNPRHARALHMMGVLLDRTPGPLRLLLAGKREQAEGYLERAVEADEGHYAYIRWSLAEFYRDAGRPAEARAQAQALLRMSDPTDRRAWAETYRPAAEALLKKLAAP